MAYHIENTCINCGSCVPSCPVSAISQGQFCHQINQEICIGCGVCASICPVSAPQDH